MLAARARGAERVDAQLRRVEHHVVKLVRFRQHGDRASRGVDAALCLGGRHALHAMAARLELELRVGALACDAHDHFLEAAELGLRRRHDLDLPAVAFGVTRVHPEEIAGKERRLVTPGAGTNFEEDVAIVVRVLRQQHLLEVARERRHLLGGGRALFLRECPHPGVLRDLVGRHEIVLGGEILTEAGDHRADFRMLFRQRAVTVEVARRILGGQHRVELVQALRELVELGVEREFHLGYRR